MVEDIKKTKDQFLQHMERLIGERGIERTDVKLMGEYADIVKDLAEAEEKCWKAEYYKTVTEAMQRGDGGSAGYTPMGDTGRTGYGGGMGGGRRGYGSSGGNRMMGHSDPIAAVRDMLATGSPEMRAQIRNELSNMINM